MNEILHANIFFVIASVATIIFTVIVSLVLYHVLKLVKSIRRVVDKVEAGSERIAADAEQVRSFVSNGGFFSKLIGIIMGAASSYAPRARADQYEEDEA